jgi:TPR repeat protein
MKLQDALKKIIREFGMSVLREKRLVFLLSDYKAFDDYPAVKQIMQSIAEDGYGKELCRLGMDGNSEECLNYAGRLKKTLSGDKHFKPELTDYAVDCILFSMGFVSSVREPSDHGFDPFGNGSANHEQGIRQKDSGSGSHKNENHTVTESTEDWYRLGMSYADSSGVNQNYSMAVEYWRKAAELGHSGAQRSLGFAYAHGSGVGQDYLEAARWYLKSAEQGDVNAQYNLGGLYAQGLGVAQDLAEAEKWWIKAAAQGDDQAKKCLQALYSAAAGQNNSNRSSARTQGYSGAGISGQNAQDLDNPDVQFEMGNKYYFNSEKSGQKHYAEAVAWWRKAAEQGHAEAQFSLGFYGYGQGKGTEQNFKKAAEWYRKSARQGYSKAQCRLGFAHLQGEGVSQSYQEAEQWFRKAAEQGDCEAQKQLGDLYCYGKGVARNLAEAAKWYRKAAEQGDQQSQQELAKLNSKGSWAFFWFLVFVTSSLLVSYMVEDGEHFSRAEEKFGAYAVILPLCVAIDYFVDWLKVRRH